MELRSYTCNMHNENRHSSTYSSMSTGLSKVAGCRRKLPPTWLLSAGYSAWHSFIDGVFWIKYPWTGSLLWHLSRLLQNFLTTLMLRHDLSLICIKCYNDRNLVKIYQNLSKYGNLKDISKLNFPVMQETIFVCHVTS